MQAIKIIFSFGVIVALALVLNGCEGEKKKAEERGKVPDKILDNAEKKIADVEEKMKDRLNQVK